MEFDQSLLGETPKAFEAINIHFARREALPMIDSKMTIAAEHKSIIAPELIGIYNRSATDRFDGHAKHPDHVKKFYGKPVFWHRGYFAGTVGKVTLEMVRRYVEQQGTKEKPRKQ